MEAAAAAAAISAHHAEVGGLLQGRQGHGPALPGGGPSVLAGTLPPRSRYEQVRAASRELLDEPESSRAASLVSVVLTVCIILSTTTSIIETIPEVATKFEGVFSELEVVFTLIFSAEILARMWIADSCVSYICNMSNVIDLVVTLPWYVEQFYSMVASSARNSHSNLGTLRTLRLVRMVRLLRVLRIAKAARQSHMIMTVFESISEAWTGFFILTAMMSFASVVSATVMYAIESSVPNGEFVSIPISMWWAITTISTVGYGDMYPITSLGKLVACITMIAGILIMSVSVAIITTSFTEAYQRRLHSGARQSKSSWHGTNSENNSTLGDYSRQVSEVHAECDVMRFVEDIAHVSSELFLELERLAAAEVEHHASGEKSGARWAPPSYALLMVRVCRDQRDTFLRAVTDLAEQMAREGPAWDPDPVGPL